VLDADQLGVLHHLAKGVTITENDQALDAIREVGPGGHYLGCAHTQSNFKEAFWRTEVFDYKPFETWDEEGAKDTMSLASLRVEKMLANYQQPPLSADIEEALAAYITKKKSSMPDSFI
jgi:trimethylamine--corrinoid protein Co-methyltransferase